MLDYIKNIGFYFSKRSVEFLENYLTEREFPFKNEDEYFKEIEDFLQEEISYDFDYDYISFEKFKKIYEYYKLISNE